jgi:hypothetical protein
MQDRKESNLGAEVAGIPGELLQSLGTGAEQEVIEDLLVLQRQLGELVRQGEDHVEVSHGQKFLLPSRDPVVASPALTLGTVAIAAAVIREGAIATAWALVPMPAQCRGAATCDGAEDFAVGPVDPATMVLDEEIALCANDVGHLERWPSHFFLSLRER